MPSGLFKAIRRAQAVAMTALLDDIAHDNNEQQRVAYGLIAFLAVLRDVELLRFLWDDRTKKSLTYMFPSTQRAVDSLQTALEEVYGDVMATSMPRYETMSIRPQFENLEHSVECWYEDGPIPINPRINTESIKGSLPTVLIRLALQRQTAS